MAFLTFAIPALLLILGVTADAEEKHHPNFLSHIDEKMVQECAESTEIDIKDVEKMKLDTEPSDKMNCFLKCVAEKQGVLNDNGELVMEKLKSMPFPPHMTEERKTQVLDCLSKQSVISTCEDMKKYRQCFRKP